MIELLCIVIITETILTVWLINCCQKANDKLLVLIDITKNSDISNNLVKINGSLQRFNKKLVSIQENSDTEIQSAASIIRIVFIIIAVFKMLPKITHKTALKHK